MAAPELTTINIDSLPAGKEIGKVRIQTFDVGHRHATIVTINPGGGWSTDLKTAHGTESCQSTHFGYVISGKLAVRMDDGKEAHGGPGDLFSVPKGHDAWCVGDEPVKFVEFSVEGA